MTLTPDLIEPILGFRVWRMTPFDTLSSMVAHSQWPKHEPIEARCAFEKLFGTQWQPHVSPSIDCSCGVHSFAQIPNTWELWVNDWERFDHTVEKMPETVGFQNPSVLKLDELVPGAVANWGKICAYKTGFRAQFTRIMALGFDPLWPSDVIAEITRVAECYDVPVILVDDLPHVQGALPVNHSSL